MSELGGDNGALAAIAGEMAALEAKRLKAFADIGEKALPELRGGPEYAGLAAAVDAIDADIAALKQREADALAEKERRDKEEKERIAKLTCFSCKTVNVDGSKFCESCGAKLGVPPREYCASCGTMNRPNMKFCGECGKKLADAG